MAAAVGVSLAVSAVLFAYRDAVREVGDWGYAGAFFSQLINNATVVFPGIGQAIIIALAPGLNPLVLGLVGGVGAGLGETSGYLVGVIGGGTVRHYADRYPRLLALTQRWGGSAVFVFAATPLPFDVAGIWAGSTRYPFGPFLLYTVGGKVLQITGLSYASFYGLGWLERLFLR